MSTPPRVAVTHQQWRQHHNTDGTPKQRWPNPTSAAFVAAHVESKVGHPVGSDPRHHRRHPVKNRAWRAVAWAANRWIDAGFVVLDLVDRRAPLHGVDGEPMPQPHGNGWRPSP